MTNPGVRDAPGLPDPLRVNLEDEEEVRHWLRRWGVTRDALAGAVRRVGTAPAAVARALGRD